MLSLVCFAAASAGIIPAYSPYGASYASPYASPYGSPYAAPYASPYASSYASPYAYGSYGAPAVVAHGPAVLPAYHAPVVKTGKIAKTKNIYFPAYFMDVDNELRFAILVAPVVSAYHAPVVAKAVIPAATSYANTYRVNHPNFSSHFFFLISHFFNHF